MDPLASKHPHFAARAKNVIFLYMSGGVSHMDSFDHKPKLIADAEAGKGRLVRPLWDFKPGGRCGTMVSDLFPHVRECMDDVCLVRSMHGDHNDHFQATLGIHTGSVTFARPSLGSWVSYGLGTANRNLPSFVVLAPQLPYAGSQVWSNDFLPGCHQGTRVLSGKGTHPGPCSASREPRASRNSNLDCSDRSTIGTPSSAPRSRPLPRASSHSKPPSACRRRCRTCSTWAVNPRPR